MGGGALLQRLLEAMKGKWNFSVDAGKNLLRMNITDDGVTHRVIISVDEDGETISLATKYAKKVPQSRRHAVAGMINQINMGLLIGGIEMDPSDGECQYRHGVDVEGLATNVAFLRRLVNSHVLTGCRLYKNLGKEMTESSIDVGGTALALMLALALADI
jgi:hypothetical protein